MSQANKKAFNYETGQFICHIFVSLTDDEKSILDDVIEIIQNKQRTGQAHWAWSPVSDDNQQDEYNTNFHITLLRGHRAIYYHQIKPLVEELKSECANLKPITLCLDQLKIFHNFERAKQFLCIASRNTSFISEDCRNLIILKERIQQVVDHFAIKLTNEDEDMSTLAHCSVMKRGVDEGDNDFDADNFLLKLEELCLATLNEYPICVIKISQIHVKIGNHIYDIDLSK